MIGPGWGGSGETNPDSGSAGAFAKDGYNVLTWDPRGFGGSGGTVMIDHPEFEGRDAQALIDFIAQQPEAQLDGPGDPRVGHVRRQLRRRHPARPRGRATAAST